MKIIDTFLFFQELDLLEIRLRYLNEHVDKFLIVEACQTFSGYPKRFVFEENKHRFIKYINKIEYFKIDVAYLNYDDLIMDLENQRDVRYQKIADTMQNLRHFPKNEIRWVLDTYHRECIAIKLAEIADDDDIIFLSDLDEIPSFQALDYARQAPASEIIVCRQKEYRYYLNYFKSDDWLGTIFGRYYYFKNLSLNKLRIDSKHKREIISKKEFDPGGYHFTSCGDIKLIKNKIQSWAHQEYNNPIVLRMLEANIRGGRDIFMREAGQSLVSVNLNDPFFFDSKIAPILSDYKMLIADLSDSGNRNMGGIISRTYSILIKIIFKLYSIKYKFKN